MTKAHRRACSAGLVAFYLITILVVLLLVVAAGLSVHGVLQGAVGGNAS